MLTTTSTTDGLRSIERAENALDKTYVLENYERQEKGIDSSHTSSTSWNYGKISPLHANVSLIGLQLPTLSDVGSCPKAVEVRRITHASEPESGVAVRAKIGL